ncbi:MAG: peptidoglycan-binding domain-containing protein [Minisyncoccia bacterium]
MKKPLVYFVAFATLFYLLSPVGLLRAQTCDPDALSAVKNPQSVLRFGARNSAVKNLQACLIEAGYNIPAGATGYYGAQTRKAVKEFYKEWYGAWHGNWVGPQGVKQLVALVKGVQEQPTTAEQPTTPTTGVSPDVLAQVLQKIQAGDVQGALSLLLSALGGAQAPTTAEQPTGTTTAEQPTAVEEGFLTVDKDPTVAAVTLREGESGKVVGLRFRADNGAVNIKSILLRWTGSTAPHRVISALKVVDSQGNVLYQTNVGPNTFLQDSSLNYYLPISGLNVVVPKNGYASVFVEVTIVGTLPSGVNSLSFKVGQNDVRGRDGAGIDRFGPSSELTWSATLSQTLAGQARFVGALNPNTPKQQYVFGEPVDGRAEKVKVLSFDLTAKNDNLRVTQITGSVTNTSTVQAVYLAQGNNVLDVRTPAASGAFTFDVTPANFIINKDQTVTFDVLVDFVAPNIPNVATFTVSVATTSGVNSLGDNVSSATQVTSEMMRAVRVGPQFAKVSADVQRSYNQQTNTSTITSITYVLNITPKGGPIYIPTSTAATATLSGGTSTSVALDVKEVRLGTTLLSHDGTKYTLQENQTYQVTYEKIATIAQYAGDIKVVSQLSEFRWSPDGTTWINADFLSGFPEYRVEK